MRIELAQCTIRSWKLEDAPSLAMTANNRTVWLTLRDRMPHPYTLRDAEAYVQQRLVEPHRLMFCIDVAGEAVGGIGVHPGDDVNRLTAELGYWLAEPYWGRGIMTAAVAAMVRYAFEHRPFERIEAYVFANNPASARVLEKCSFTFEGRMRRNVIKDGVMLDSLVYALLRNDVARDHWRAASMTAGSAWRARARAALEAYFERRSFPRTMLTLVLIISGLCGFFVSYVLLRLGVAHMWVRYPIGAAGGYGILLGLVRLWVELERRRFDPDDVAINDVTDGREHTRTQAPHYEPRSKWHDCLNVPDFGGFDFDEGCLPAIILAVILGLVAVLVTVVAAAPLLIAEVFLDVFIVVVLYRRLRIAEKEHWVGTAIRRTWAPALITVVLLAVGGVALEAMAPGARSVGPAIEQIRTGRR